VLSPGPKAPPPCLRVPATLCPFSILYIPVCLLKDFAPLKDSPVEKIPVVLDAEGPFRGSAPLFCITNRKNGCAAGTTDPTKANRGPS